ncbi:hypothetical protein SEUCBS140593_009998 [Sporothrix eucalyptigena]|uniref:HMA domain-containing protein n=1 Tax=Sporothrix eucalyptigena TaxID=1812306 RepID=A0ABP0D0H6_9PEZI
MACCYIAAYCVGQLVKASQFFDFDQGIRYNDEVDDDAAYVPFDSEKSESQPSNPASSSSLVINITGMTCSACTTAVEDAVSKFKGVDKIRVSLPLQQATVVASQSNVLDGAAIIKAIDDLGYDAEIGPRTPKQVLQLLSAKEHIGELASCVAQLIKIIGVLQVLYWGNMALNSLRLAFVPQIVRIAVNAITLVAAFYIQVRLVPWIHKDGWKWATASGGGFANFNVNMNTLISLSIVLGLGLAVCDFASAASAMTSSPNFTNVGLTLVVVSGRYLEALSRRSAFGFFMGLYKPLLKTNYATLHPSKQVVPASFLQPNDTIVVDPFRPIPCDCYVAEGTSLVSQSMATGESLPVSKTVGDFVLGGTRNQTKPLVCVVQKQENESFHTQLAHIAENSTSTGKTSELAFVHMAVRYFVMVIVTVAVILPVLEALRLWPTVESAYALFHGCALRTMTILTSACPCALGLAVPSVSVAFISAAAKRGILVDGGMDTIKRLQRSRTVIFDKTGTLTESRLNVEDLVMTPEWQQNTDLLWKLICAVEERFAGSHPVARAVFSPGLTRLRVTDKDAQPCRNIRNVTQDAGLGVSGEVSLTPLKWRPVHIGSRRYLEQAGIEDIPAPVGDWTKVGGTLAVYVAIDGKYAATLWLADVIREEARGVIGDLQSNGYECAMLTGDVEESAQFVSKALNIRVLGSQAMPTAKQDSIRTLQAKGKTVTMVGDGMNDGPALATADVGIGLYRDSTYTPMGASVVILNSRLDSVALLYQMAAAATRQVHFNLLWVFTYNLIALSMASGFVEPFGFKLTPSIAAIFMSLSSVFITSQSLGITATLERL